MGYSRKSVSLFNKYLCIRKESTHTVLPTYKERQALCYEQGHAFNSQRGTIN